MAFFEIQWRASTKNPSRETQREVQEGLNVVENWNATTDFISLFGIFRVIFML